MNGIRLVQLTIFPNHQPSTINHQPSTINHQPSTINHLPSTIIRQRNVNCIMRYKHLFFDLDHTLWDFDTNSREALKDIYHSLSLAEAGVFDFDLFHKLYLGHNERLWDRYRNGHMKVDELRWKRMALSLLDFKIGDEILARKMGIEFLEILPTKKALFPDTVEVLNYLTEKKYNLHLITNGFEKTQHHKLKTSGIDIFFGEIITSEGSNSLKPHPEIFEYAISKTGGVKKESIMIGDTPDVDISGARDAGIDQVYVNHTGNKEPVIATFTVYSLKELMAIF
jgi:putative hydrolase of the HAD superfamily